MKREEDKPPGRQGLVADNTGRIIRRKGVGGRAHAALVVVRSCQPSSHAIASAEELTR